MNSPVKLPIYLDYQATTPVDPRVFQHMQPYFTEIFGNPASKSHGFGLQAEAAVEHARSQVAAVIGAEASEVVWTSGATEAVNLAIKGVAQASDKRHLVTVATEHSAVLDSHHALERDGFTVTYLAVSADGLLDPKNLSRALRPDTALVSVMLVNNEIGVIQPVAELGRIAHDYGVPLFCDAAQALGKIPLQVSELGADFLAMSAHKTYGPKGVGALWLKTTRPKQRLVAQLDGGGHERGLRSGTLNVPAIVGFGVAAELASAELASEAKRILDLRERLRSGLQTTIDGVTVNGSLAQRVAGNLNLSIAGVPADTLLMNVRDVALSSGSACSSASPKPSHVLRALGLDPELASCSLRFGVGRYTTAAEIDFVVNLLGEAVYAIRRSRQ